MLRDAQGNVLAIYQKKDNNFVWKEQHLYGSSRLGILQLERPMASMAFHASDLVTQNQGIRNYELTNHLGNVLSTITDKGVITSAQDYFPFGLTLASRSFTEGGSVYRFGFNGKEDDKETGLQDYGMRLYLKKLGRFPTVDPLTRKFPELTPYQFASNTPIQAVDLDGLEAGSSPKIEKHVLKPGYPAFRLASVNTQGGQAGMSASNHSAAGLSQEAVQRKVESTRPQIRATKPRVYDKIKRATVSVVPVTPNDALGSVGAALLLNLVNDVSLNVQDFTGTKTTTNLDGTIATSEQRLNSFINIASMVLPVGELENAGKAATATLGEFSQGEIVFNAVMDNALPGSSGAFLGESRLGIVEMEVLTQKHGVEFAQVYTAGKGKNGGGGYYTLYSGTKTAVDIPLSSSEFLINHTHPGGTTSPSTFDINYLKKVEQIGSPQKSSVIIPIGKPAVRFNKNTPANGVE